MTVNWTIGATFPFWEIPLQVSSVTGPTSVNNEDLTNVNISLLTIIFEAENGALTPGTGTIAADGINPGSIIYQQSIADVARPFTGAISIRGYYPPSNSAATEAVFDPISLTIS